MELLCGLIGFVIGYVVAAVMAKVNVRKIIKDVNNERT